MRFTTAAVVTGLAAVAAADNGWGNAPAGYGGWGESSSWAESSAAATTSSSAAVSSPVTTSSVVTPSPSNVWVTDVVTAFTTYCPYATEITHKGSTYSVTEATTLTITNCPGGCTITRPATTSVVTVCNACSSSASVPAKPTTTWAPAPKPSAGTGAPWKPSANSTSTGAWSTGSWSTASATPSVVPYKGAASKTTFGFAGLIAAVGLVAAL